MESFWSLDLSILILIAGVMFHIGVLGGKSGGLATKYCRCS